MSLDFLAAIVLRLCCHRQAALLPAAAAEMAAAATAAAASPAASVSTTVAPSAFMASTAAAAPTVGAIAMAESYCYSCCYLLQVTASQGWEFAHRLSEQIARFLRKK